MKDLNDSDRAYLANLTLLIESEKILIQHGIKDEIDRKMLSEYTSKHINTKFYHPVMDSGFPHESDVFNSPEEMYNNHKFNQ